MFQKNEGFAEFPRIPTGVSNPAAPFDESPALTIELQALSIQRTGPDDRVLVNTASLLLGEVVLKDQASEEPEH